MNDNQRTAVLAAIAASDLDEPCMAGEVSQKALRKYGRTAVKRVYGAGRMAVSRSRIELPAYPSVMTVLHAVAHAVTDPVFPAHGAEFCATLLDLTQDLAPYSHRVLRQEFAQRRVHHTPEQRRRAAMKAAAQRASDGTQVVQVVLDDPPDCVVGEMTYRPSEQLIVVDGDRLDLSRLRYLAKVS